MIKPDNTTRRTTSRLYASLNADDVLQHMIQWGVFAGGGGAALYMTALLLLPGIAALTETRQDELTIIALCGAYVVFAAVVGGFLGLLQGFINGILMAAVTANPRLNPRRKQLLCFVVNIALCVIPAGLLAVAVAPDTTPNDLARLVGLPYCIAALASVYATRQYFRQIDPRKRRPKSA